MAVHWPDLLVMLVRVVCHTGDLKDPNEASAAARESNASFCGQWLGIEYATEILRPSFPLHAMVWVFGMGSSVGL